MLTLYSKPNCPYCVSAKHFLNQKGIPYDEKMLGVDITSEELTHNYPFAKTFPMIFEGTRFIGGFNELTMTYNDANKLLQEGK